MATIRKELTLSASPAQVWDVIRDVGAIHRRLAPGFVTDTRLEEGVRVVTTIQAALGSSRPGRSAAAGSGLTLRARPGDTRDMSYRPLCIARLWWWRTS